MRPPTTRRRRIDGAEYAIRLEPARSPGRLRFRIWRLAQLFEPAEHLGEGMVMVPSIRVSHASRWNGEHLRRLILSDVRAAIRDVTREVLNEPAEAPTHPPARA